jgi:hypothetical protein
MPRVRAAGAPTVALRLFLEERHRLPVRPAWAVELAITLIAILPQPPPHVAFGLVPPECSGLMSSHVPDLSEWDPALPLPSIAGLSAERAWQRRA